MRDLSKAEYGMLQESMVQVYDMTGKRPEVLLVHPIVQRELGVSLSLFAIGEEFDEEDVDSIVQRLLVVKPARRQPEFS